MKPFYYTSLHEPITKAVIRQYEAAYPKTEQSIASLILMWLVFVVGALFTIGGASNLIKGVATNDDVATGIIGLLIGICVVLSTPMRIEARRKKLRNAVKFARFAAENNLLYQPAIDNPPYPGMIFGLGNTVNRASDVISSASGFQFEFGNFMYTIDAGKSSTTKRFGYICVTLDKTLPNMVLDSLDNNPHLFGIHLSNLPISFKKDQILHLEGDFDKHFTLYAPQDYKEDALYVFTPDLMALMIDEVSKFDAEIVDNKLYIYKPEFFSPDDQDTLGRIYSIISLVGEKTLSQTEHYQDDQAVVVPGMNNPVIVGDGRRLKRRIPTIAFIIIVAYLLLQGGAVLLGLLSQSK